MTRRDCWPRPFPISATSIFTLFCFLSAWCANTAFARETHLRWDQKVHIGWQGAYIVGRLTPVTLDVEVLEPGEFQLHVTAPDPDGHRVTFSSPVVKLPRGKQRLHGFFKLGERDPDGKIPPDLEVRVDVVPLGQTELRWRSSGENQSQLAAPLTPATRLIATAGNPSGFEWQIDSGGAQKGSPSQSAVAASRSGSKTPEFHKVSATVDQLPTEALAYDSISLFVLAGQTELSAEQSAALRNWVAGGGRLVISLSQNVDQARQVIQPLADWLPVSIGTEPVTVREFGRLEHYSGRNVRIPFVGRMAIPAIRIQHGVVLAGSRDEALLVRSPFGLGTVTVLALDLTQAPLSKWAEVSSLGRRLVEDSPEDATTNARPIRSAQLSSTGISDLATQLHAAQDNFADVRRVSPWMVMGLLAVFLLVIGPLDYQIVHRILKRPRGTWVTFPLWVVLATVLASRLAAQWNGSMPRVNQLNLVNLDLATSTCTQRLWTNVYSPENVRRSVRVHSTLTPAVKAEDSAVKASWSGIPEMAFGGMLRPAGLLAGRSEYQLTPSGEVKSLPLMQWSSKSLVTEVSSRAESLVESDLQGGSGGRLSGTLTHRFAGPIEDWILVYGNRVYRQLKQRDDVHSLPLAAGKWRVDQPNVFQRELRAFLTGQVTVAVQKSGAQSRDVSRRYADYDPLSLDPAEIVRMLTFHEEAGGTRYSGLTNRLLEAEDLSRLLKLGRAVLFGRLSGDIATVEIDGQTIRPDRETTFVRIILPVTKVGGDTPREIEKFEP